MGFRHAVVLACLLAWTVSYAVAQSAAPQVTILGNSIDLSMSAGYVDTLRAVGIGVQTISAGELPQHQGDPLILILGGQHAPEGVGQIVDGILTAGEKDEILSSTTSKVLVIIPSLWAGRQKVMVFAGYGKEQTRKLFGEAQGDLIKSIKFNDSSYLENNTGVSVDVPPIDPSQPFTEVDAYQANAIIQKIPGVVLIDVRGAPFYAAAHIPGAVNLPQRQFAQALTTMDKDKTYLLYCGGNSESIKAGNEMAALGYKNVYRLVDGYIAWRKAGYPREKSA